MQIPERLWTPQIAVIFSLVDNPSTSSSKAIRGRPCSFVAVGVSLGLRVGETDADGDEATGALVPTFGAIPYLGNPDRPVNNASSPKSVIIRI